jgi:site-specific recombinase XerD
MTLGFMSDVRLTSAKVTYLLDCRAARLAPRTVRAYRDVLTRFITFTGDIMVQELKPDHVRTYIAELSAQGGPMSKHYMVIRLWIRWLYAQKVVTDRIEAPNKPPRASKRGGPSLTVRGVRFRGAQTTHRAVRLRTKPRRQQWRLLPLAA